jgi:2-dehydropantoate 2-reductase
MATHAQVSALVRDVMRETEAVAARLGIELPISVDQRIAGAAKVGAHKTSMLQDVEAGRPLELDPVVGAVLELGERLGIPMPATRAVYACAALVNDKLAVGSRQLAVNDVTNPRGEGAPVFTP